MSLIIVGVPTRLAERTCHGCMRPVIRNLAIFDSLPYHFGCLKRSRGRPDYQCLNCFAYWTRGRLTTILFDEGASRELFCPECGSGDLRRLERGGWD